MSKPVLVLWLARRKDVYYQLSEEEQEEIWAKKTEARANVGGKTLVIADCEWSSGQWQFFGVQEYPDVEALQKHMADLREIGIFQYSEEMFILGTKME